MCMLIIHTWFLLTVYIQVSQVYNIIIRLTHANVWESMKKPCRCMQFIKAILFATIKSCENLYQYYKSQESVLCTECHVRYVWTCNEIESLYDKVIITISTKLYAKNITRLLPLHVLHTPNNTDGNKLMIFSSVALYYDDTSIISKSLFMNHSQIG